MFSTLCSAPKLPTYVLVSLDSKFFLFGIQKCLFCLLKQTKFRLENQLNMRISFTKCVRATL